MHALPSQPSPPRGAAPTLRRLSLATPLITLGLLAAGPLHAQAPAPADAPPPTVAGAWRIEQARSEPMLDKRQARLDFQTDGTLSGHTSCNALRASYRLDGDRLSLGPVVTTRQRCAALQMAQEDRVLTALEAVATARVRPDGLLELRDADGRGVLRATRIDGPP